MVTPRVVGFNTMFGLFKHTFAFLHLACNNSRFATISTCVGLLTRTRQGYNGRRCHKGPGSFRFFTSLKVVGVLPTRSAMDDVVLYVSVPLSLVDGSVSLDLVLFSPGCSNINFPSMATNAKIRFSSARERDYFNIAKLSSTF